MMDAPSYRPRLRALLATLLALLIAPSARGQQAPDGAALFQQLCARCHGISGNGQGAEVLDRPARDFTAGGFSFGNTEAALTRTIANGIPGSPMPAFGETLSAERLAALARHVVTLAPTVVEASESETELVVERVPVLVRGGLPPIAEDAPAHARGLMLGLPEGLSFEYRLDDVALLGVRAGQFVQRTDWTGRGGTPLEPLGVIVWLNSGGEPGSSVWRVDAQGDRSPLRSVLLTTHTPANGAWLTWQAVDSAGRVLGLVEDAPRVVYTRLGSGFARQLRVTNRSTERLLLGQGVSAGELLYASEFPVRVIRRPDGRMELSAVIRSAPSVRLSGDEHGLWVSVPPGEQPLKFTWITLLMDSWNPLEVDDLRASLGNWDIR